MVIDTHTHLNLDPLLASWEEVFARAVEAGVGAIVIPGTNEKTSLTALELAQKANSLYAAIGLHPSEISDKGYVGMADFVEEYVLENKVVAIGEIGLDYLRLPDHNRDFIKKAQQELLMQQLVIARDRALPVILHSRDSETLQDIETAISTIYPAGSFRGVFHCFSHTFADFQRLTSLGEVYIGVGGLLCRPNQVALQETVSQISLKHIVLETDSPLLVPHPVKAKTNEPANVTIVALKLAAVLRLPLEVIMETTTNNATRLFQLD